MYKITKYSFEQAKKLGVTIKPSNNQDKKIDVFNKKGEKVASIGALGMGDYPTYMRLEKEGKVEKGTAMKRRKLYKQRHESDRHTKGTNGFYADKILW
jgi:phage gp16-like protein